MNDEQYRREYGQHLVEQVKKGHMTRRQLLIRASVFGIGATAAGQLLAACGGGSSSSSASPAASGSGAPAPKTGGTAKVIISPSITDLDPVTIYDTGGITLIQQFCEYLINLNDDMTLKPVLAESWSPNTKGDVWTFKLRQGVKFNDGSPFGADDVVTTFDRLCDPKSGSAAQAALAGILAVGGTKKIDDATVAFNLEKPFADFPYLVCQSSYNTVILSRNYKAPWIKNHVGTGPYLLKSYTAKQSCTAAKNPTYWRKDASGTQLPYLDTVDWIMVADQSAQTLQLQSGAADVVAQTPYQGSQPLFADPNLKVSEYPSTGMREVFFNVNEKPWTDYRVRQAVAWCLDRPAIIQALFGGKGTLGNDTVFSSLYPNAPTIPDRAQDIAKAKQLLSDAGYPNGLTVTLSTEKYLEVPQYAQLIKAQCAPAGITVNVNLVDYNTWYAGSPKSTPWLNANFGIVEWGQRPTPAVFIQAMLLPTSAWNSSHWNNKEFVTTFDQYMATVDQAARLDLATKLATLEQNDTPTLQAFWITQLRTQKKNVYNIIGPGDFYCDMSEAYIA